MATRRQAQRRSLLQFLALVIAIVIIVVAVVFPELAQQPAGALAARGGHQR